MLSVVGEAAKAIDEDRNQVIGNIALDPENFGRTYHYGVEMVIFLDYAVYKK